MKCHDIAKRSLRSKRKVIQMFGTLSFANINTGKVFVKKVKNLFGITLVIMHINLATKFIAYEIKASERIVVLKVFSRMIKFQRISNFTRLE